MTSLRRLVHEVVRTILITPPTTAPLQFMVGYNDDQLGAGEEEEGEVAEGCGGVASAEHPSEKSEYDQMLLQMAVQDFESNFLDNLKQ